MTWHRDLAFLALVGGGLAALAALALPPRKPPPDRAPAADPTVLTAARSVDVAIRAAWPSDTRPADPAPDLLVARRLALGLMGTVPSLEEVRRFEALPPGDRVPWWLEHVLDDRRSAEYLAERFARAFVGTEDGPFVLFRRRRFVAWLADELARNRPYDELAREVIAGRGLWTDRPATNFVTVTSRQDEDNQPDPVRLAGRVSRAFLGLRIDCAQCHDHPFASWRQADFDGLAAFFGQTRVGFTGVSDGDGHHEVEDRKTRAKRPVNPAVPYAPGLVPVAGTRRERLAAWVTHRRNPYFARAAANRVWALLFGRPLAEPVDDLEPEGVPADGGPGRTPPALLALADDFAAHGYDLRRLIRVIAATEAFRRDSADPGGDWAAFPLTRLRPEQVAGAVVQAGSVATIDADSHVLARLMKFGQTNDFVKRYGDTGEDEFENRGGTIPQRLLLMNGTLVRERTDDNPFNASTRIGWLAATDAKAVEAAYLAVLTRRPTPDEAGHFAAALADRSSPRPQRMEDLCWALVNATEFSWNH